MRERERETEMHTRCIEEPPSLMRVNYRRPVYRDFVTLRVRIPTYLHAYARSNVLTGPRRP